MSSSQQQQQQPPPNPNNGQQPNPQTQLPLHLQYNDYEDDESIHQFNNFYANNPLAYMNNAGVYNPDAAAYYPPQYANNDYDDDTDEYIQEKLEEEIYAREGSLQDDEPNLDDGYEGIYSDEVQNAFENYENECAPIWKQNQKNFNNISNDEDEEMFRQMQECMRFMSQEYSVAEMPENLVDKVQSSTLNPDALVFEPWSPASSTTTTATDKNPTAATSLSTYEAKKEEEN